MFARIFIGVRRKKLEAPKPSFARMFKAEKFKLATGNRAKTHKAKEQ